MSVPKILGWRNDWAGAPDDKEPLRGTGYYRIVKPLHFQKWAETFVFGKAPILKDPETGKIVEKEDIIPWLIEHSDLVLMRNISQAIAFGHWMGAMDYHDKPCLLDMDDDYIHVDELHPDREYFKTGSEINMIHEMLFKEVTGIIAATEPLGELYKQFNPNVHVLKNYHDMTEWNYPVKKREDGRICIGWCGSTTHESDFEFYYPVMKELWKKYGKKIVFKFNGFAPVDMEAEFPNEAYEIQTGTQTMLSYIKHLAIWGYDIGVAPLKHSYFNDGKGHGKWMEYASYKIPMVGENYGPYKRECKNGHDASLCTGVDEWVAAISKLIDDPSERERIGTNAYNAVLRDWQWKDNAWRWEEVFKMYLGRGFHENT